MSDFKFQIEGDASKANKAIQGVESGLDRLRARAIAAKNDVSGIGSSTGGLQKLERQAKQTAGAFDSLGKSMKSGIAIAGIGIGVRELGQMADGYTNLQNRLMSLTGSQESAAVAMQRVRKIAVASRGDLGSTGEAYVRIARATEQLGLSQDEVGRITETLSKAISMSGASSSEAAAGMMQLAQGMASGRLQGDELRSVLENIPSIGDAIAKSMGVTRGELRKLGEDGKITTEVMVKAFKEAQQTVDSGFAKSIPTLSQSLTQFKNDVMVAVGEMNEMLDITGKLSGALQMLSDTLSSDKMKEGRGLIFGVANIFSAGQATRNLEERKIREANESQAALGTLSAGGTEQIEGATNAIREQLHWRIQLANNEAHMAKITKIAQDAFKEKTKAVRAHAVELSAYAKLVEEINAPEREAIQRYNLLGQAFMNRAISQERYNEEIKKTRDLLIDIGKIEVKSVTSGLGTPTDPTAGINTEALVQRTQQVDHLTAAWHREIEANRKANEEMLKLGQTLRPVGDALIGMLRDGEFSAQKLEEALADVAIELLKMAAIQALGGVGGGGSGALLSGLLGAAHGGNFTAGSLTGFAHGGTGTDSQIVAFRKSPNETASITVETPIQRKTGELRGGGTGDVRIVNQYQDDPRAIRESLSGRAGERVIYNTMKRMPNRARR